MNDSPGTENPALRRVITLPLLALYGLGVTIGAGIYVLIGVTAQEAGVYAPVSFLAAACVVAFTAFSYAELVTRFPVSAGEAAFVRAGFGNNGLSTAVGLAVALSGIVSAAAITIGAASYLQGLLGLPVPILSIATIIVVAAIACWGIAESVRIVAAITLIEVAGLLLVIFWGYTSDAEGGASIAELLPPADGAAWSGIVVATLLAFFAFVGFEDMVNVAEEVKEPRRTFPAAVVVTLLGTTLLYVATASAVIVSVPMANLAASAAPLALVFANAPPAIGDAFAAVAVIATLNGVLIQIIMASRVIYGLANAGQLPRQLATVAQRTRTPILATIVVATTIVLLTQTLAIDDLARFTSQVVLVLFTLVNIALLRLGPPTPEQRGSVFVVPRIVPAIGIVSNVALLFSPLL